MLFDLDGTLIDSLHAVDRAWTTWALKHDLDPVHVLSQIHGRRSIESIKALLPEVDAAAEDLVLRRVEEEVADLHRLIERLTAKGCVNCHSQVHGSNSPNGTFLTR